VVGYKLAVRGGLGVKKVGRQYEMCFQKVSVAVSKLVGKGTRKGARLFHTSGCLLLDELHQDACMLFTVNSN
jgi:hypothetical protein